jgi:hypothetical protein
MRYTQSPPLVTIPLAQNQYLAAEHRDAAQQTHEPQEATVNAAPPQYDPASVGHNHTAAAPTPVPGNAGAGSMGNDTAPVIPPFPFDSVLLGTGAGGMNNDAAPVIPPFPFHNPSPTPAACRRCEPGHRAKVQNELNDIIRDLNALSQNAALVAHRLHFHGYYRQESLK